MKESISYTFLLNIIILFIFVCFAVIMGTLSYYRAYKAGAIIVDAIEKYEGLNCLSKREISQKLGSITYNVPFNISCRNNEHCEANNDNGYMVVSKNIDFTSGYYYGENDDVKNMNSNFSCPDKTNDGKRFCFTNKHYQYTVYTYMYFDLPVINKIVRIPVAINTKIMYEFRNFFSDAGVKVDLFSSFIRTDEAVSLYCEKSGSKCYTFSGRYFDLNDLYANGISDLFFLKNNDNSSEDYSFNGFDVEQSASIDDFLYNLSSFTYPDSKRDYVYFKNVLYRENNLNSNENDILKSTFSGVFSDNRLITFVTNLYTGGYSCGYKLQY